MNMEHLFKGNCMHRLLGYWLYGCNFVIAATSKVSDRGHLARSSDLFEHVEGSEEGVEQLPAHHAQHAGHVVAAGIGLDLLLPLFPLLLLHHLLLLIFINSLLTVDVLLHVVPVQRGRGQQSLHQDLGDNRKLDPGVAVEGEIPHTEDDNNINKDIL